ncbi:MAG: tetratricopeptide repeat protein, partial [Acidimicrobiales bacterium]|nr:tetratricopeptide repeat protein [Acidimicrobiales bacterium]
PLFARWESLHRFLLKSTAAHPDDRFQSAPEMAAQLTGVLREVVALSQGTPRPAASALFGGDHLPGLLADNRARIDAPDWRVLPSPRVDPADPAASFLQDLPDDDPSRRLDLIAQATGTVEPTVELFLARARALIEIGADAQPALDAAGQLDLWDWRIRWYRALELLSKGTTSDAAEIFSQVWTDIPGEVAPKLAVALAAEYHGALDRAARLYEEVMATDPSYVSAAFGLARCRRNSGDVDGAVAAYRLVPTSSATYYDAQLASARAQVGVGTATKPPSPAELQSAARTLERLQLDATERANLSAEILERALASQSSGGMGPNDKLELFGESLTGARLRDGLEAAYREQARMAATADERIRLAERATRVRRWTLF